jgi:hypothetical protein
MCYKLILLFSCCVLFFCCRIDFSIGPFPTPANSKKTVYVAGNEDEGRYIAKYWKNGVATALTDGTNPAIASAIVVIDG